MTPTSTAILLIGLLVSGLIGYLAYTHIIAGADRNTVNIGTLEQLARTIESGGVVLPQKAYLEKVDSWIKLGSRRYNIELARLVFNDCYTYAEPQGRSALEVWGNWTSCGLVSIPVLRGEVVEFYTANATGEVGSIRVSGNKTILVVWTDRIETPWWTVSFEKPTRIVVVERNLSGR